MREKIEKFYEDNFVLYVKRLSRQAGSIENAEDVVQEAFTRALQYSDSYVPREGQDMEKWFNSIVRRALWDFKRIETKQGMTAAVDNCEPEVLDVDSVDQAMAQEIVSIIENKPNQTHKNVLYLFFIRGYKPQDIMRVLGLGDWSAYQIIKRFKQEMAERYGYNRQTKSFS